MLRTKVVSCCWVIVNKVRNKFLFNYQAIKMLLKGFLQGTMYCHFNTNIYSIYKEILKIFISAYYLSDNFYISFYIWDFIPGRSTNLFQSKLVHRKQEITLLIYEIEIIFYKKIRKSFQVTFHWPSFVHLWFLSAWPIISKALYAISFRISNYRSEVS